jgi:hypothetical protein
MLCERVGWIQLARDSILGLVPVNAVKNCRTP